MKKILTLIITLAIMFTIGSLSVCVMADEIEGEELLIEEGEEMDLATVLSLLDAHDGEVSLDGYTYDADFEAMIADFPEDYKDGLRSIHAEYPNYVFIMDQSPHSFQTVVDKESTKKLEVEIESSWKACYADNYNWSTGQWITSEGGWTYASKEVVAYFIDPRNFLNTDNIYMFMKQTYSEAQTIEGLRSMLKNSFMENNYTPDPNDPDDVRLGGDYALVLMEAAQKSHVSPYVLAAMILLEQGRQGNTDLISGTYPGYEGIYDFYNFGATGATIYDVIINGFIYSKNAGWTSRYKSIVGGAEKYYNGYLGNNQDTAYYKGYNVLNGINDFWHQYETSLMAPYSTSYQLGSNYRNYKDASLVFRIPVYTGMPETKVAKPKRSSLLNNYYFSNLSPSEGSLSPAYSKYTFNYSLSVSGDILLQVDLLDGTEYSGQTQFDLKAGQNKISLSVISQTGYSRTYTIDVNASKACTLRIIGTGIPYIKQVDGVWCFAENEVIYTNKNDIIYGVVDGVSGWWKITKGLVDFSCNSIEHNSNGWWYIVNGKVDFSYNGIGKNSNGYWAVQDGKVTFKYTGIVKGIVEGEEAYWYFKDSALSKTSLVVTDATATWYVKNGKVDTTFSQATEYNGGIYKFKDGKADSSYEGIFQYGNDWYYFNEGLVTGDVNDVIEGTVNGEKAWWLIKNSKVAFEDTAGVNQHGTWYVDDGKVDFGFSGAAMFEDKLYYFEKGKLDESYTGFAQYGNDTFYLENGIVTGEKNDIIYATVNQVTAWWHIENSKISKGETVAANKNGTWYVNNGKVDFTYTGFASNADGDWYVEKGQVTFKKNSVIYGKVNSDTAWWYVKESKVTYVDTIANNENGWWRIKNGAVDFNCNSIEENENGWWYLKNGKVDFSFTGFASNKHGEWYVEKGQVTFKVTGFVKGSNKDEEATWYVRQSKVIYDDSVENNNGTWVAVLGGKYAENFTGFLSNKNGDWYLENGKVTFKKTDVIFGSINSMAAWWYVENSQIKYVDTVARNSNGWWKITKGSVDFSYNGVASNNIGTWVIENGKVNFSYNGEYKVGDTVYKVSGGKVIQ